MLLDNRRLDNLSKCSALVCLKVFYAVHWRMLGNILFSIIQNLTGGPHIDIIGRQIRGRIHTNSITRQLASIIAQDRVPVGKFIRHNLAVN